MYNREESTWKINVSKGNIFISKLYLMIVYQINRSHCFEWGGNMKLWLMTTVLKWLKVRPECKFSLISSIPMFHSSYNLLRFISFSGIFSILNEDIIHFVDKHWSCILYICILSHIATSLSLFFPSFVRLIDVFNTLCLARNNKEQEHTRNKGTNEHD
jgi:hypothetical protein